jgi:hypothetical protein
MRHADVTTFVLRFEEREGDDFLCLLLLSREEARSSLERMR